MEKKVTIQDIADALNLSRNTVSKAINNSDGLAESTRETILQKAVEMGYKQFSYVKNYLHVSASREQAADSLEDSGEIALLTASFINSSHFASPMLDKFTQEIHQLGYHLVTYRVTPQNIELMTLPRTFSKENIRAVMCIEIFDQAYSDLICSLGLPTLFVDSFPAMSGKAVNADLLLMDNLAGIIQFIGDITAKGIRKIGFIGDYTHCQSFYERYLAFRIGMMNTGLKIEDKYVICPKDGNLDIMADMLEGLDDYPDAFICANDFVAIDAMLILRMIDKTSTQDIRFLGFDDSPESRSFVPTLSTVHIHTQAMAFSALQLLITRIKEPAMENRIVHVATDLILRESTQI